MMMNSNRFRGMTLTCPYCKETYPISIKEVNECPLCLRVYMKHYTFSHDNKIRLTIRWIDNQHVYKTEQYSIVEWCP